MPEKEPPKIRPPTWEQFVNETPINGFKEFTYAKSWVGKVGWSLLLLTSLGCMATQLYYLFDSFINEKTGTEFEEWHPTFIPAMSFCPRAFVNYSKVQQDRLNLTVFNYSLGIFALLEGDYPVKNPDWSIEQVTQLQSEALQMFSDAKLSISDFFLHYSYELEYFFPANQFLLWQGQLPLQRTKGFTWRGICYSFAPANITLQDSATIVGSINIELNDTQVSTHEYFSVLVGNRLKYGTTDFNKDTVTMGMAYDIDLRVSKIQRSNLRRAPCKEGGATDVSGQHHCIVHWSSRNAICEDVCKPYVLRLEEFSNDQFCNTHMVKILGLSSCHERIIGQGFSKDKWWHICPPPCVSYHYEMTIKSEPTTRSRITIRLVDTLVSVIRRQYLVVAGSEFLSNIGGTMALWFGGSFIAIFHAIYVAIHWVIGKLCHKGENVADKSTTENVPRGEQGDFREKNYRAVIFA